MQIWSISKLLFSIQQDHWKKNHNSVFKINLLNYDTVKKKLDLCPFAIPFKKAISSEKLGTVYNLITQTLRSKIQCVKKKKSQVQLSKLESKTDFLFNNIKTFSI